MCIIALCIDDEGSSGDEILHSFEPSLFESIHKPDDDQSSSNENIHPFKPRSLHQLDNSDDEEACSWP